MATQIEITGQSLPADYCLTTLQQLFIDFHTRLSGELAGSSSLFTVSSSTPSTDDEDRPWFRLSGTDKSPERLYQFWQGQWVSLHQTPASDSERRLWVGSPTELITYDGGAAGTVTDTTGPMWEVDTLFAAKFPFGVGTTDNGTEIEVTVSGGEDDHVLTEEEMPAHVHGSSTSDQNGTSAGSVLVSGEGISDLGDDGTKRGQFGATPSTGGDVAHNNLPPYYGVYYIKRTSRRFYVAA